ncbi:FkbM family methyltransferase [Rhodococcus zopfii]|uniref:FkbM family methyltransferase n=1 Tax=Rhodococcus zopfii TaxID=43772 RepID=UPI0014759BD1|nr:FkbM family methyltransferase [Rhodococcus zopfii]
MADLLAIGARAMSWIEPEIRGLAQVVREGDACIDVGAEYGLYTFSLARLVGPHGRVVAVEPLAGPARWLRASAGALGARTVTVAQVAVGARGGIGEISVPRRGWLPVHGRSYVVDGSLNAGSNSEFRSAHVHTVTLHTLDHLRSRHGLRRVGFVKADVEGAELAVLTGAEATLADRPTIMLEIEERHLARYGRRATEILDFLHARNYRMHVWGDEQWHAVTDLRTGHRNYLFIPAGEPKRLRPPPVLPR